MNPRQLFGALVTTALAGVLSAGFIAILAAQNTSSGVDPFQKNVQPFLAKNCYGCHSGNVPMAHLNLAAFTSESAAAAKPDFWERVLEN